MGEWQFVQIDHILFSKMGTRKSKLLLNQESLETESWYMHIASTLCGLSDIFK